MKECLIFIFQMFLSCMTGLLIAAIIIVTTKILSDKL